jgi:hypothetical protein
MRRLLKAVSICLAVVLAPVVSAKEKAGVKLPDTVTVADKALQLKGLGVRTKVVFKVYVAGLYVEDATKDAAAILAADAPRRVHLVMLRDVDKQAISDAIREGFTKNSKAQLPALSDRLKAFTDALPDLKSGDQLVFTYVPGKGTELQGKAQNKVIEGKDFSDALLSVWLGPAPVDSGLKKDLLGAR